MADNVAITAGSGTSIATDDVGPGVHYQVVKLMLGADGAASVMVDDGQQAMAGSIPVCIASDQSAVATTLSAFPADVALADDAAFTPGTTKVVGAGFTFDDTASDLVDEGDIGIARMTADRRVIVAPGSHGAYTWANTASATTTDETSLKSAAGASTYLYVSALSVYNSSATNTYVTIKDGSTAKMVLPAPAYGGSVISFPVPWRLTANTALQFASAAAVSTMYVSCAGYTALA